MSALPPKADIDHDGGNVCFVPLADIATGHSTNSRPAKVRDGKTQRLSGREIDYQYNLLRLLDREIRWIASVRHA